MKGLLVDFGGVLTTNVFDSWRTFCELEDLPPDTLKHLFRDDPRATRLVRAMETAAISEDDFGREFGELLGIDDREQLLGRMFGHIGPDQPMLAAVRSARRQGVRTGLISNSMGNGIYAEAPLDELFDGIAISSEVGFHKPQPEMYRVAAERAGIAPEACVFVDDLRENCVGAEAVGMTAVLHRGARTSIPRMEDLLGLPLRES